jgi:hypothetical protein
VFPVVEFPERQRRYVAFTKIQTPARIKISRVRDKRVEERPGTRLNVKFQWLARKTVAHAAYGSPASFVTTIFRNLRTETVVPLDVSPKTRKEAGKTPGLQDEVASAGIEGGSFVQFSFHRCKHQDRHGDI